MSPDTGVREIFMEGLCSYPVRSELWLVLSASRRHCFNLTVQRWDLTGSYQGQRGSKTVLGRSGDSCPLSLQPGTPPVSAHWEGRGQKNLPEPLSVHALEHSMARDWEVWLVWFSARKPQDRSRGTVRVGSTGKLHRSP